MKKVLIFLGIVAVIGSCVFSYSKYTETDSYYESVVNDYCNRTSKKEFCSCAANEIRAVFGRDRYIELVEIMKRRNRKDVEHFILKISQASSDWEVIAFGDRLRKCKGTGNEK